MKRIVSFLMSVSLILGMLPVHTMATGTAETETTEDIVSEATENQLEQTNSLGEIGGYLAGNAITTAKLFAEHKFTWPTGFGFAAERGNNLIDRAKGINASVVGDNNAANGPDRMIINRDGSITWIQDKYCSTAKDSVNSAFDDTTGLYRYIDGDGKPMMLEVPSDQYDDAVSRMRGKIENGRVPGVTDPDEAVSLVRKGNLTFEQAQNIAEAGNVDSLKYDAANGVITASCAAGMKQDFAMEAKMKQ